MPVLAVWVIIQFIRPEKNLGEIYTDNHIAKVVSVPSGIDTILQMSCYDCHSNQTRYPWYIHVEPVGWWLSDHINEGKRELNFSEFRTYKLKKQLKKLKSIASQVKKKEMPLPSYLWLHGDAKLTDEQVQALSEWATESHNALAKDSSIAQGNVR